MACWRRNGQVLLLLEKWRRDAVGDHRDFVLMPHNGGNSENTVTFIKHLQNLNPDKKLILIWDGASYHRSEEVRAYLNKVNEDLEEKNWKITCLLFAPNAPEQNPVEDVWLRGKNFLRKRDVRLYRLGLKAAQLSS